MARTSCARRSDALAPPTATCPSPVSDTCTTDPSAARPSGTSRPRSSGVLARRRRGGNGPLTSATKNEPERAKVMPGDSVPPELGGSFDTALARITHTRTADSTAATMCGQLPTRSSHASITESTATSIGPAISDAPARLRSWIRSGVGTGSTDSTPVSRRVRRRCSLPRR
jgi:hypothetical protein